MFARARSSAPCVVFFDELDALAPRRGGSGAGGNNATERVVNQLLTELDGLDVRRDVFVGACWGRARRAQRERVGVGGWGAAALLHPRCPRYLPPPPTAPPPPSHPPLAVAATNRPDILDPAMLRPGRLDKLLYVPLPSPSERASVLRTLTRGTPCAPDVDCAAVAGDARCERFSGADLAGLVREASVAALREWLAAEAAGGAAGEAAAEAAAGGSADAGAGAGAAGALPSAPPQPLAAPASILVGARHFDAALSVSFPSVSPADERLYNSMQAKLRGSRAHMLGAAAEATGGGAGNAQGAVG